MLKCQLESIPRKVKIEEIKTVLYDVSIDYHEINTLIYTKFQRIETRVGTKIMKNNSLLGSTPPVPKIY